MVRKTTPAPPLVPTARANFSVEVETITPKVAAEYLACNGPNRKISRVQVNKWVKTMLNGQWKLTGETIKFDVHGTLIDGQHRLAAVIESGVVVQMVVTYGCAEDVFPVLDDGKRRSGADVLTTLGVESVMAVAATLKIIKAYSMARMDGVPIASVMALARLSNYEIPIWYETHSGVSDWIMPGLRIHKKVTASVSSSAVAAALYLGSLKQPEETATFADSVILGEGLVTGEAPLLLLNRGPVRNVNLSGEAGQAVTFLVVARALENWYVGKKQTALPYAPTKLPDFGEVLVPETALQLA